MMNPKLIKRLIELTKTADDKFVVVDKEMRERVECLAEWLMMTEQEKLKFVDIVVKLGERDGC